MWLLYFEQLGVPAAIIKNRKNYSVWKFGLECVSADSPPLLERAMGAIVREVHSFGDYWPKRDKAA